MKPFTKHGLYRLVLLCVVVLSLAVISGARSLAGSITIVNNSSKESRNVYFSHVNTDDWGADQLGESTIPAGQSYTINNITWDQQQIKVIGEDQDGCFISTVVASGDNSTWTVTNATATDCGGGN